MTPADGMPGLDVDPYDPDVLTAPHDYYAKLRQAGEVVLIPRYSVLAVARYATRHKVFSDHENFVSSRGAQLNEFTLEPPWRPPSIILKTDPPEHTRARRVMAHAMSPKSARDMGEMFREVADRIVERIVADGVIDGVTDLTEPYPTQVFPRAVGMKDTYARHLVDYGAMVFNAIGPDNELRRTAMDRAGEIVPWITGACTREHLTGDGLGAMIYTDADRGEISHDEAGMLVRSFLSAGVDTTVTGIGNALWCLSQNPGEWDKLKADPSLARPAFEEVLRFTSPVHTFGRTAGRATGITGVPVAEGTKGLCVLGAANMEHEKWGDPEVFRIDRRPSGHIAFGTGIHGYVGQSLARAELEALLRAMVARIERIEPAGQAIWPPTTQSVP